MKHYAIVANKTLPSEELVAEVQRCLAEEQCDFYVVVPASHPAGTLTWTESGDHADAERRLALVLKRLRATGIAVDGEIGDTNPMVAITDALAHRAIDHIIVSTLPTRLSRWLKQDLPHRVRQTFGVPVTHIVATVDDDVEVPA